MTNILFLIETLYRNIFRCNYLRNKRLSLNIFLHFRNLHLIWNILNEKMTLIADVFLNLRNPKNVPRLMSKKYCFRGPLDKQHGKQAKLLLTLER